MITSIQSDGLRITPFEEAQYTNTLPITYWKRPFDFTVAFFTVLLIFAWLFPIIALLIKLTTPGPIFFVQLRTGRNGRPFRCFKFRTMRHTPNNVSSFEQTKYKDSRVTWIGRWLRRTNLDEMPQFINVLKGEMSIVGPRPHAIEHDAQYWFTIPGYHERYMVTPGITGLAQVRGARGATNHLQRMEHRIRYDRLYISSRTLLLDIKICLRTVKLTVEGDSNAW